MLSNGSFVSFVLYYIHFLFLSRCDFAQHAFASCVAFSCVELAVEYHQHERER